MLSTRARWGLAATSWAFVTLVYSIQVWFVSLQPGEVIQLGRVLGSQLVFAVTWIPLTVAIWQLTDRWDPAALGWRGLIGRHLLTALLVSPLQTVIVAAIAPLVVPGVPAWQSSMLLFQIRGRLYLQLIIYAGVAAAGHAMSLAALRRERAARAAMLETQLAEARLDALRAQLHPHFLFNSLHAISALVREQRNDDAVRLLSGLGDLLRRVLDTGAGTLRLEDEVAFVRRYLEIQQVRFGDRLRVDLTVDARATSVAVPALLVQPLVENAIGHGISPRVDGGRVAIDVRLDAVTLRVQVDDDGPGMPAAWSFDRGPGTGLRNLRDRLQGLFGPAGVLEIGTSPLGGTRATIRLPVTPP